MMNVSWLLASNALFSFVTVTCAFVLALRIVRGWIADAESRASVELIKQIRGQAGEQEWMREELTTIDRRFVHLEEMLKLFETRQDRFAGRGRDAPT